VARAFLVWGGWGVTGYLRRKKQGNGGVVAQKGRWGKDKMVGPKRRNAEDDQKGATKKK